MVGSDGGFQCDGAGLHQEEAMSSETMSSQVIFKVIFRPVAIATLFLTALAFVGTQTASAETLPKHISRHGSHARHITAQRHWSAKPDSPSSAAETAYSQRMLHESLDAERRMDEDIRHDDEMNATIAADAAQAANDASNAASAAAAMQ
jgi:hypothetical protein